MAKQEDMDRMMATGGPMALGRIGELVDGEVCGDPMLLIRGAAPFDTAGPDEITFAAKPSFLKRIHETGAGAVLTPRAFDGSEKTVIRTDNPEYAFALVLRCFHPPLPPAPGISERAFVHPGANVDAGAYVGPFAVVEDGVSIGVRSRVHAGVVIESGATIGDDVVLHPNVVIHRGCILGNRVVIHAGSVIGGEGFGLARDRAGYIRIPQTGIVRIDDDVEIGALNAVDRAAFGETRIRRGVKTDNLVQVGHNCDIGEDTVLVSQVGVSGSVTIGKNAVLAGQAGVSGHLTIGDNVIVGPQAGLAKSVEKGQVVSGSPEMPHRLWLRVVNVVPKLPDMLKKIKNLETRIAQLESPGEPDEPT